MVNALHPSIKTKDIYGNAKIYIHCPVFLLICIQSEISRKTHIMRINATDFTFPQLTQMLEDKDMDSMPISHVHHVTQREENSEKLSKTALNF